MHGHGNERIHLLSAPTKTNPVLKGKRATHPAPFFVEGSIAAPRPPGWTEHEDADTSGTLSIQRNPKTEQANVLLDTSIQRSCKYQNHQFRPSLGPVQDTNVPLASHNPFALESHSPSVCPSQNGAIFALPA